MPPPLHVPGAQQQAHQDDASHQQSGSTGNGLINTSSNGTEALSGTTPPNTYVTTGQINRHDVLCGRGQGINDNPGNLHFRSVVSARKAEYVQAPTNKKKSQIAREVIHRIRFELSPPGRFLKRATPDDVRRLGIDEGTIARAAAEDAAHRGSGDDGAAAASAEGVNTCSAACGIWIPVTEAVMVERAKMSLRRQEGDDRKDRQNRNRNAGHSSDSSLNAAQLMMKSTSSIHVGTLGDSVPQYGASSVRAGVDHSHSSMHTSGSSLSNFDANILALVSGASAGGGMGTSRGDLATATASAAATAAAEASPNVNASAVTSEAILSSLLQRQQQQRSGTPMTSLADATSTLRVRQTSYNSYGADTSSPAPTFVSGDSSPSLSVHGRTPRSGGSISDASTMSAKGAQVGSAAKQQIDAKTICSDVTKSKTKGKRQVDATADKEGGDSNELTNLLADALLLESSVDAETNVWEEEEDGMLFQDFGNLNDLEQDLRDARENEVANNNTGSGATAIPASGNFDDGGIHGPTGSGHGPVVKANAFGKTCEISPASVNQNQQLLHNVKFALSRAQMLVAEHKAAETAREPGLATTVQNSLNALGQELFVFLTGIESSALLSESEMIASARNDGFLPNQKPRKRTVHAVGLKDSSPSPSLSSSTSPGLSISLSDKLRDTGVPVSFSTVVISLLDATDPNASERYRTAADVEADLGRMISNPDRYLFDPPLDQHSGKLCFVPNRLYGRTREWEQVKSAFDKIIVAQEETHGYLIISGPPGR